MRASAIASMRMVSSGTRHLPSYRHARYDCRDYFSATIIIPAPSFKRRMPESDGEFHAMMTAMMGKIAARDFKYLCYFVTILRPRSPAGRLLLLISSAPAPEPNGRYNAHFKFRRSSAFDSSTPIAPLFLFPRGV